MARQADVYAYPSYRQLKRWTDEFFEDDYMAPQVMQALPERMTRAFNEYLETRLFQLQRQQIRCMLNLAVLH